MRQFHDGDNGQSVRLTVGDRFEVCLAENPTTGYRWQEEAWGAPACALTGDDFAPGGGATGGAGRHCWRFQAAQAGPGEIRLVSRRGSEDTPMQTFQMTLEVTV